MDAKLKGFFDAAQQKAGETIAAQTAAAEDDALRKTAQSANRKLLKAQIDKELGPILEVLKTLPEKDGKRFWVSVIDRTFSSDNKAEYMIDVAYAAQSNLRADRPADYDGPPRPRITMDITRKENGALDINITQGSITVITGDESKNYKQMRATDFETARQELALGLGTFAADRMTDIGAALGAAPATTQTAPTAEEKTPAPQPAARKRFWQRFGIG